MAPFLALLSELRPLGKTDQSGVKVVNFKGLRPSRRSLLAGLGCGCVSVMILVPNFIVLLFWVLVLRLFRERPVFKRRSENQCKKDVKMGAQVLQLSSKKRKKDIKHQKVRKLDIWSEHALTCEGTVADRRFGELERLVRTPVTGRSAPFRLRFRFVRVVRVVRAGQAKLCGRMMIDVFIWASRVLGSAGVRRAGLGWAAGWA